MLPGIFLDRDGVIIENRPDYVKRWDEVQFLPGTLHSLAGCKDSPYRIIIITNQAGIGRGLISRTEVYEINRRILAEIDLAGGRIDAIYVCPHTPEENCACRKPQPGMILQAAADLHIDLPRSMLIGDNISDLQAGRSAGVGQLALVRTGLGEAFASQLQAANLSAVPVFADLAQALAEILGMQ